MTINPSSNGAWQTCDQDLLRQHHYFDMPLAEALSVFLRGKSVVDFGCGLGEYVFYLLQRGIVCRGYDGNPYTRLITRGLCDVQDLSVPFELGYVFDWVLSLEVGEHIPPEFAATYLRNLHVHNAEGIILSWAVEDQPGIGHVNCQNNEAIRSTLAALGYRADYAEEAQLRTVCTLPWFKQTLMVFRKT
jgi:SAM-dependent methyltransferase